jgi:hypothetical protein
VPFFIPQPGKKFYFRAQNTFPDSGKEKSFMGNAKIILDSDTGFSRIRTGRFRRHPGNLTYLFTWSVVPHGPGRAAQGTSGP